MASLLTRSLGGLALVAVPVAFVLLRAGADRPRVASTAAPDSLAQPFVAAPAPDSAPKPPPRPPRPVTPGVELVVNIPSGRLELLRDGELVKSYPVSVGSARYATPRGTYQISRVIYNPTWHPPESEWARDRKPEPPGPGNPMGRVKLHMSELYYIHGTTAEGRLGAPASHGCIRMANRDVVELARRIQALSDPEVTTERLDALSAADRKTREVTLPRSVRLRVSYQVAVVRGGRLHVYPDVYARTGGGFADTVRSVLARAGHADVQVGSEAMRGLRARARARGGASFALAELPTVRVPEPTPPTPPAPVRLLGREIERPADDAPVTPAPGDTAGVAQLSSTTEPVAQP